MKNMKINIPKNVTRVIDTLETKGFEAYVVGGCVRDSILNRTPNDWDITTNATPEEVQILFNHTIPTGIKHGTVTVMIDNEGYEVTTYRIDGDYSDNRRPDSIKYTKNIEEDLARRDFTINAMAYNPKTGLVDPFNGITDIKNKVIRCVGKTTDRFNEDSLRMLRAVRFSAQLEFKMRGEVRYCIESNCKNIKNISVERIQSELNKILLSNPRILQWSGGSHLLDEIIPEINNFDVIQNNPYHWYTSMDHCFMASEIIEPKLHLRLAALFHDIGKSNVETTDENGVNHFYGHSIESVKIAEDILKRLKYDNNTIKRVLTLIEHHDRVIEPNNKSIKKFLNKLDDYDMFKDWCSLRMADILSQNPLYARERIEKLYKIKSIAEDIISRKQPFAVKDLDINGNHLISLGYKGKEIGEMLNRLLEEVIEHPEANDNEYLMMLAKKR